VAAAVKHDRHFKLAYAVLALAFWVSVGGFTYLMTRGDAEAARPWSAWRPQSDDLAGAREIARHVAPAYRADTGRQLVAIQEHPPRIQGLDLEAIGVRTKTSKGFIDPYISLFGARRTLIYAFCGLAQNCSVPGTHTDEREHLLRREALELTLYSFKYLDGIDTVVSLLPPTGSEASRGVFFRKEHVEDLLERPIRATLPNATPPFESSYTGSEASFVENVTARRVFPASFEALPDGDAILVLELGGSESGAGSSDER